MRSIFSIIFAALLSTHAFAQGYDIYVSDAGQFSVPPWQILKYDENGDNPEVFISENLAWPHDIVFLEEASTVLVSNYNSGNIERYHADTGKFIDTFASGLSAPTRMKIGPDGLLYVCQAGGLGKVKRYDLNGTFIDDFTSIGLEKSLGLDWDRAGNLYVSDYDSRIVRAFDRNGVDLGTFISNNLAGPTNIWFNKFGDLLVIDYDAGVVRRFNSQGVYQGDIIQGLSQAEGVDYLPDGNIVIGNGGTSSVKRFNGAGAYVEDIVSSQSGGLKQPNAVVVRAHPFEINSGLNDAWYYPLTAGQGFLVVVYPELGQMFVAWFTYDVERPPDDVTAMLGEPGHRWLTAQGPYAGDTANLTLYLTEGGVFDSAQPPPVTDLDGYGTMTVKFSSCAEGSVDYEIPSLSLSGSIPIERVVPDNEALCEALQ
ncbi:MAG: hypothetical protein GWP58_00180 [Gammaproteobacteria bacterium]|jgi:hypothetical protein|nr:hypothetical protein [Gammaproteobacteria bacterium]